MLSTSPTKTQSHSPTRIIHDVDDTTYELTFAELAHFPVEDVLRCATDQLLVYIWQENRMAGFRFLLVSSPTILPRALRTDVETRFWPTTASFILLLYQGPSGIYEATYSIPTGPRSLAPVMVLLDSTIAGAHATITSRVFTCARSLPHLLRPQRYHPRLKIADCNTHHH